MTATRLPRSGNAALAAGALIQAVIGLEFILAGLNKIANPDFSTQFKTFVEGSPGASHGLLAPVMQALIVPHVALAADLVKFTELGAGIVLVVSAIEVARRRFAGRIGAQEPYEAALALAGVAASLAIGGMSLAIFLLEGGQLPMIGGAFAFGSPIAVELLIVPLAVAIAWLEFGRFRALSIHPTS